MTLDELRSIQLDEDKDLLEALEQKWLKLELMKVLAASAFDRYYWAIREKQTDEQIERLERKMVRRFL